MILVLLVLTGCRSQRKKLRETGQMELSRNAEAGFALLSNKDFEHLPKVNPVLIDEIDFRVNAVRISVESYLLYETPVIIFELPKLADYVEILRCPHDAIIYGGSEILENVELSSQSSEEETKIFRSNNFWEAAISMGQCQLVASSYRDKTFEDTTAPTGKHVYYLRSCVDHERLLKVSNATTANCSRQITKTRTLAFKNERRLQEIRALAKANDLRNQIDGLGRSIVRKTQMLHKLLFSCQQRHNLQIVTKEEKEAISTLVGLGIGAGLGAASVGSFAIRGQIHHRTTKAISSPVSKSSNNLKTGIKAVGAISMIGTAAYVTSLIYQFASDPPFGYPVDDRECYRGKLSELANQLENQDAQQALNLCSCSDALYLKTELKRMTSELEYLIRLRDVQMQILSQDNKLQESIIPADENKDDELTE